MKFTAFVRIAALVLAPVLRALTPVIEDELEKFLLKLYDRAEKTDNPLDDMFVGMLLDILDIERPGD